MNQSRTSPLPILVWWIIWGAIFSGVVVIYTFLGRGPSPEREANNMVGFICLVPLAFSCVLRWAVMPGQRDRPKALVIFILGLATAEGSGLIGLLLGGDYRTAFFALGVVGILQWIPTFARRFEQPSSGSAHGLRSP
ncbi:MAG: hypothetical protein ABIZ81_14890 [Opitutaceae bacterium]